jgi:putative colanic acid biosysnthesis UDP-glucose lipid carrier transferase
MLKNLLNSLIFLLILILIAPIFITICILVFTFIDKKVFFKQKRIGFNNNVFICYKFSTMLDNHLNKGDKSSDLEEIRINYMGKFLRKTFLDELPQLINIVKGEMNLIGPRPHSIYDHELFKNQITFYNKRHKIKPGITGLAQSRGFNGPIKNKSMLKKRIAYDSLYIKKKSIILDFSIILNSLLLPFLKKTNDKY